MECISSNAKIAFEENKAQEFLTLLLTADERDAVGLRLQIVSQLIDKNMPQREIQTKSEYKCCNNHSRFQYD